MSVPKTGLDTPSQQDTATGHASIPQHLNKMQGGQTVEMIGIGTGSSRTLASINTAADRGVNSNPSTQQPQPSSQSNAEQLWYLMRRNELSAQPKSESRPDNLGLESNQPDEGGSSEDLEEDCPPQVLIPLSQPLQILHPRLEDLVLHRGKLSGPTAVYDLNFGQQTQLEKLSLPQNNQLLDQEKGVPDFGEGARISQDFEALNNNPYPSDQTDQQ